MANIGPSQQINKAFAELLLIFAELFKYPEEGFYAEIKNGILDEQVKELSQTAGLQITTRFNEELTTYKEMVHTFNTCFLGVKTPFAPLVESVYKVWTTDDSYQVPHKNQKGYLMGDAALHVKHILQSFGLEIPKEYEMMPDHLAILLEIYAFLIGQGLLREAKQFKQDHLDWLPDLCEVLSKIQQNKFYNYTAKMLCQFLDNKEFTAIN